MPFFGGGGGGGPPGVSDYVILAANNIQGSPTSIGSLVGADNNIAIGITTLQNSTNCEFNTIVGSNVFDAGPYTSVCAVVSSATGVAVPAAVVGAVLMGNSLALATGIVGSANVIDNGVFLGSSITAKGKTGLGAYEGVFTGPAICVGYQVAGSGDGITIGYQAGQRGSGVVIGNGATHTAAADADASSTIIGAGAVGSIFPASANPANSTALGALATSDLNGVAVGTSAGGGNQGVAIGASSASTANGVAVGYGASNGGFSNNIAIGHSVVNTANNQIVIGDNTYTSVKIGGVALGAPVTDYTTPATGFTYTVPNGTATAILQPAGTLATGTINMPATPADGQQLNIASTQQITALTMSGNGKTLLGPLTTIGANGFAKWQYRTASTTWYRIG